MGKLMGKQIKTFTLNSLKAGLSISVLLGTLVAVNAPVLADNNELLPFGIEPRKSVKWTKQVPGYDPIVNFSVKWPTDALVAGHADLKTPLIFGIAKAAVITPTAGSTKTALRIMNWSYKLAAQANTY